MILSPSFYAGLGTMTSLIVAIGAQNNFVLRQGLRQEHVTTVVGFCIMSDIALICAAVFGLMPIVNTFPTLMILLKMAGIAFLLSYAALSFKRAFVAQPVSLSSTNSNTGVWLSLIGFTWLNPHVWIDTIFLLGAVAQTQSPAGKLPFMLGASLISIMWFCALGYGARILKPVFNDPIAWKFLDSLTGALMLILAINLALTP